MNINRREFLVHSALATGGLLGTAGCANEQNTKATSMRVPAGVTIHRTSDPIAAAPPSRWAIEHLRQRLVARGVAVEMSEAPEVGVIATPRNFGLSVGIPSMLADRLKPEDTPGAAEELAMMNLNFSPFIPMMVVGSDPRGLAYALTDLADRVSSSSDPLEMLQSLIEASDRPANAVRSCMRMFCSDVEDKSWFNDKAFWEAYLTMLVTNRFNRFQLAFGLGYDFVYHSVRDSYTHFMYPFFVSVPGYDVRATNVEPAERDRNLEMLRFVSEQCALRGLQFQLGLWNHAYNWPMGEGVNHMIEGLSPDKHAAYCRDGLAILLKECPGITGLTFRIHGEGGIAEGSYDFWKTIFDAPLKCGRQIGIDMHSKGIDQGMIDTALATGLPVTVSPKYWAEHLGLPYHQAAIRPTEMPTGRRATGVMALSTGERNFTRYGYADLMREDRKFGIVHRIWPGTQRLLLWGDPVFAAGYSRAMSFCGSLGCELMEPLSFKGRKGSGNPGGRDAYLDKSLKPRFDFEKYSYTYRLWGRLLYNPDTDPEVWRRELRREYGDSATKVETALSNASRILPLFTTAHTPSAANNNYWPEVYVNMSLVDDTQRVPYGDTPTPRRFGFVSPLDPQLFSTVDQHAESLLRGEVSGKYSPIEVAHALEQLAQGASLELSGPEPAHRRLAMDVRVQRELGVFFALRLRGAVLYALHEKTADPEALRQSISLYQGARQLWASIVDLTKDVYVRDISFGNGWFQRGHWSDRLEAIDRDIAALEKHWQKSSTTKPTRSVADLIPAVRGVPNRPTIRAEHTPPQSFERGKPLAIALTTDARATLHYRHVNQAERWQSTPMQSAQGQARSEIPTEYADSPYPLQYYFELRDESGRAALNPGFNATWSNQPYFIVRAS
jgi:hypothetical protein